MRYVHPDEQRTDAAFKGQPVSNRRAVAPPPEPEVEPKTVTNSPLHDAPKPVDALLEEFAAVSRKGGKGKD